MGAVAEDTVLKDDRVSRGATSSRVRDAVSLKDPTALSDNVMLVTIVAPELGVIGGATTSAFTRDSTFVLAVGLSLGGRLFEGVEVDKVGGKKHGRQGGGGEAKGDELAEVETDLVEESVLTIVGNNVVEEGHLEGCFISVVGEGRVKEGTLILNTVVSALRGALREDLYAWGTAMDGRGLFSLAVIHRVGCVGDLGGSLTVSRGVVVKWVLVSQHLGVVLGLVFARTTAAAVVDEAGHGLS